MAADLTYEGCNFYRQRLVLSTLSGKSVRIKNIRSFDDDPGLKDFEAGFIRLLDKLTNGSKIEVNETGTSIFYKPGLLIGGTVDHDCSVQRSVGYFLESIVCLAPFCKRPLKLTLRGVTNDGEDPSVDVIKTVTIPLMKRFLLDDEGLDLKVIKRGAPPNGGGEVLFSCPIRRTLRPLQFTEPGKIKRIRGLAYSVRVSPAMVNRIVDAAREILNKCVSDIYIHTDHCKGSQAGRSPGFGLSLVAESTKGVLLSAESSSIPADEGEVISPEDLGRKTAVSLLNEIYRGGCVDSRHQCLPLLFMVLGQRDVSKLLTGPLSPYTYFQVSKQRHKMSCSEDETNAASVLSQMSQSTQPVQPSDNVIAQPIDNSVIAHQCDVETTSSQEIVSLDVSETLTATTPVAGLCSSDDNDLKIQPTLAVSSSVKVYPCEFCGKVFNKSYNLKTHHRVHSGERPYQCTVCGHGFANLGDLKRHNRTHTGEKPYTCEYCNKSFSDFGSHKRHLRLHTGDKPFKCDKCEREFTRLDSYKNHVRLHTGVRPYKCDECQKEFNYLTTYKRHQNIHSGKRPYSCDQCGKKFTRLIYMKNHKQSNCGRLRAKKSQENSNEEVTSNDTTVVSLTDVSRLSEEIKIAEGSMLENIANDLSMQRGVQLNVAKVIYANGETQPVLIETGETTSHTLILTTNPEGGQQLLELTAGVSNNDEPTEEDTNSAETIFITQSLTTQNVANESLEHGTIVAVKTEENVQNIDVDGEVAGDKLDGKLTEISEKGEDTCSSDPSAMYIAIDPTL